MNVLSRVRKFKSLKVLLNYMAGEETLTALGMQRTYKSERVCAQIVAQRSSHIHIFTLQTWMSW